MMVGDLESLIDMFACAMWLFYIANCFGVFILRVREPDAERSYRVPLIAPIIFVLVSSIVLCIEFMDSPKSALASLGLVLMGLPFYNLQANSQFRYLCCFDTLEAQDEEKASAS